MICRRVGDISVSKYNYEEEKINLQHCLLIVQKRICLPRPPREGVAVHVLHGGPGDKPGVADLDVLVALLY